MPFGSTRTPDSSQIYYDLIYKLCANLWIRNFGRVHTFLPYFEYSGPFWNVLICICVFLCLLNPKNFVTVLVYMSDSFICRYACTYLHSCTACIGNHFPNCKALSLLCLGTEGEHFYHILWLWHVVKEYNVNLFKFALQYLPFSECYSDVKDNNHFYYRGTYCIFHWIFRSRSPCLFIIIAKSCVHNIVKFLFFILHKREL